MSTKRNSISSVTAEGKTKLKDDFELLDLMLLDSEKQLSLYNPGPYWARKAKNTAKELKRYGIENFRGSSNTIGLSYTDSMLTDIRNIYSSEIKNIFIWLTKQYPLKMIFEPQVKLTNNYANANQLYIQEILNIKEKTRYLLEKYKLPYSLLGGCLKKATIDDNEYSTHYLNLLEQHDNLAKFIRFDNAFSVFEIGGGFGANIHLLLENYRNIRKVLYLDIVPNLYVGTQYLKAIYGASVFDYRNLKDLSDIKFSDDDNLEIFCITPWQIEGFNDNIDIFMNSHSFVEIPKNVIQNYVDNLNKFPDSINTDIALTSYDNFDLSSTFEPSELATFFKNRNFNSFEEEDLLDASRKNFYFVSPGKAPSEI